MKLLLAGGGTGGHVNPAIAIAEAMKRRHKDLELAFVGRTGGEENRAVSSRGFKLYTVDIKGFSRKISADTLKSAFLALKSLKSAERIISDFEPDVIVATGGYVCWPIVKTGIKMKIPTLMHESNIYPGLVTRMLGGKCDKLLLNSEKSTAFLKNPENCIALGNPLRESFFKTSKAAARKELGIKNGEIFILSFGGSLGSEKINEAVLELMKSYTSKAQGVVHLHSAGERYFEKINEENKELTSGFDNCKIQPYIDNMASAMSAADIVISRAGAMTLTEIAKCAAAAILIPSPNVADDHQRKNAEALVKAGAAIMITEDSLDSELLGNKVFELITNKDLRASLSENIKKFYDPHSSIKICNEIDAAVIDKTFSAEK